MENLQYSLQAYLNDPKRGPLSFESLPVVEVAVQPTPSDKRMESSIYSATKEDAVPEMEASSAADLYQIPQFAHLGKLFRSTRPVELTESETEYVVSVVKHVFDEHVVLQVGRKVGNEKKPPARRINEFCIVASFLIIGHGYED